jgi:hypothetical protein
MYPGEKSGLETPYQPFSAKSNATVQGAVKRGNR